MLGDRRPTPACAVVECIGAGIRALLRRTPRCRRSRAFPPRQALSGHPPAPPPPRMPCRPWRTQGGGGETRDAGGTAPQLCGLATAVFDLWVAD